jgi:putative ABC transport system ATP-binding protein
MVRCRRLRSLPSVLGCLLTPDDGGVQVLGQDMSSLGPKELTAFRRDHLGFIFQTFNLFPTLSALDNVSATVGFKISVVPNFGQLESS